MARIQLRYATIYLLDGFGGTAAINGSPSNGDTTVNIDTIANVVNGGEIIPTGVRFTTPASTTEYTVLTADSNKVWTVTFTADAGYFIVTLNGVASAHIPFSDSAAQVATAINTAMGATDVAVTGVAGAYVIEAIGALANLATPTFVVSGALTESSSPVTATVVNTHAGAVTWLMTFTPPFDTAPADDVVVTFLPHKLTIKVGDGDVKYTENTDYKYDLDRGLLDTVRLGDDTPMDVDFNFVYEHITTGTNETIAPMDALKRKGNASNWVSSALDQCEPYSVDVVIDHIPPCGTSQIERTTFPDFRADKREVSFKDSNIAITGKCNVLEPIVERLDTE